MMGLAFADGVVVSPNVLVDNNSTFGFLGDRAACKYLNEEGAGKFIVRGFGLESSMTVLDYYDALPETFLFSSLGGKSKQELTNSEVTELVERLRRVQFNLDAISACTVGLNKPATALRDEIYGPQGLDASSIVKYFPNKSSYVAFEKKAAGWVSRSEWYEGVNAFFSQHVQGDAEPFKREILDPAYSRVLTVDNEAFIHDNINVLPGVPGVLMEGTVGLRALRKEISLISFPLELFQFIHTFGIEDIVKYLTDEACNYVEDKLSEKGFRYLSRRNWFGMYPMMARFMGVELK
jgi:hypothetical protein